MAALKTDYRDDIIAEGVLRKYNLVHNEDGTVSLQDMTTYQQEGDDFGAADINATNEAVNKSANGDTVIDVAADLLANTQEKRIAGALAVKALVNQLTDNISALQTLMQSFESAKSKIISSALGKALGMTASTALATVADKIVAVVNRGALNWSGVNTTMTVGVGWYSGGTLDSRPSYNKGVTDADARVNANSANYKGGYNAGVAAAVSPSVTTGLTNYTGNPEGRTLTRSLSAPSDGVYMFLLALILPHNSGVGTITTSTTGTSKHKYDSANNCADLPRIAFHVARLKKGQTITYTVNSVGAGQRWSYIMLKLSN